MKAPLALVCLALLAGCATPYAPNGMPGGYSESQLAEDVFRVTFKGNGYTKLDQAEEMALLRSAEVVSEKGYSHFVLLDERVHVEQQTFTTPMQARTTGTLNSYGSTSYLNARTQYTGGQTFTSNHPMVVKMVKGFRGEPQGVSMAYSARFIIDSLGPKYKKP